MKKMIKFLLIAQIVMMIFSTITPFVSKGYDEYEELVAYKDRMVLEQYYKALPAGVQNYLDSGIDDQERLDQITRSLTPEARQSIINYTNMEQYLKENSDEMSEEARISLIGVLILYFILYIAGIVGIWKSRNWGRICYVIATIICICLTLVAGDGFSSNFVALFATLSDMLLGAILILLFTGSTSTEFKTA